MRRNRHEMNEEYDVTNDKEYNLDNKVIDLNNNLNTNLINNSHNINNKERVSFQNENDPFTQSVNNFFLFDNTPRQSDFNLQNEEFNYNNEECNYNNEEFNYNSYPKMSQNMMESKEEDPFCINDPFNDLSSNNIEIINNDKSNKFNLIQNKEIESQNNLINLQFNEQGLSALTELNKQMTNTPIRNYSSYQYTKYPGVLKKRTNKSSIENMNTLFNPWLNKKKRKNNPLLWQYIKANNDLSNSFIMHPSKYSSVDFVFKSKRNRQMVGMNNFMNFSNNSTQSNNMSIPFNLSTPNIPLNMQTVFNVNSSNQHMSNKMYLGTIKKNETHKKINNNSVLPLYMANYSNNDLNGLSVDKSINSTNLQRNQIHRNTPNMKQDEFKMISSSFLHKTKKIDLENITVYQLKLLMKEYGLNHTGKKSELIMRVRETRKNLERMWEENNDGVYF